MHQNHDGNRQQTGRRVIGLGGRANRSSPKVPGSRAPEGRNYEMGNRSARVVGHLMIKARSNRSD